MTNDPDQEGFEPCPWCREIPTIEGHIGPDGNIKKYEAYCDGDACPVSVSAGIKLKDGWTLENLRNKWNSWRQA